MKKLFSLVLLLLSGCSDGHETVMTDVDSLKFKAGDEVVTSVGFYSSCEGTISSHSHYHDEFTGPRYGVSFYCPNIGRLEDVTILESSLKKKEK